MEPHRRPTARTDNMARMAKSKDLEKAGINFSRMLNTAVRLPLIQRL